MKAPTDNSLNESAPVNVALQRPTVNLKQSSNVMEQAQAVANIDKPVIFSKHGTFRKNRKTHPGLE